METPDLPLLILQRNKKEHIIYLEPSLNLTILLLIFQRNCRLLAIIHVPKSKTCYKQNLQRANHLTSLHLPVFKNMVRTDCCALGKISGMGSLLFSTGALQCLAPSPSAYQSRHYVFTALSNVSLTVVIKQNRKFKDMTLYHKWKGYTQTVMWNHPVTAWQGGPYTA